MTEESPTTTATTDQADASTLAPDAIVTSAPEPSEPGTSSKSRSRGGSSSKPKAKPSGKTQTCAGCGKSVVFDESASVGGREPISFHGCEPMRDAIHAWSVALLLDPSTEAPKLSK